MSGLRLELDAMAAAAEAAEARAAAAEAEVREREAAAHEAAAEAARLHDAKHAAECASLETKSGNPSLAVSTLRSDDKVEIIQTGDALPQKACRPISLQHKQQARGSETGKAETT